MTYLFNELLYRPLLNLLFFIYNNVFSDLGLAIILLTIIIRFVLLPLFYKSAKDQTILQSLAPRVREIQKTHKENKEKQVQEIMSVYREHKVSPFSGILLLLIQLPILIALYKVFLKGFSSEVFAQLYSFVPAPETVHSLFLGFIDLNENSLLLVIVAALFQYLQSYFLMRVARQSSSGDQKDKTALFAEKLSKQMVFVGPLLTLVILYSLPSAVALYWLTTSAFSVVQQLIINKKIHGNAARTTNS